MYESYGRGASSDHLFSDAIYEVKKNVERYILLKALICYGDGVYFTSFEEAGLAKSAGASAQRGTNVYR